MAKKKAAKVVDSNEEDLLKDEGGEWKEHEVAAGGEQVFDISDDPNDVDTSPNVEEDEPDLEEKKVAQKPQESEEEDLLADADVEEEEEVISAEGAEEEVDDESLEPEELGADFLSPWEKKNYSKAMAGRVTRERRLKRQAEDETATQTEKLVKAEERATTAEKLALDLLTERVESEIEQNKLEIIAAKETGDTKVEVDAQTKLQENLIKKREIERSSEVQKKPEAAATTDTTGKKGEPAKKQPPSPQLKRWVERNRWFTNTEFADEEGYTRAIDAQLTVDPAFSGRLGTPSYFAELDRRIHKKMPTLRGKIKKVFGAQPTQKTAPVDRGTSSNIRSPVHKSNANKVTLTAEDIANAAAFGITTPEELKQYARNKHIRETEERQGSR